MSVIQAQTSSRELRFVRCDDEGRLTTNLEATIDDVLMKGETAGGVKTPVLVQTDGKLESMCFGKTGAGADKELLVESDGSFVVGGGSVKVGNTVGDGSGTGTFLKTATDGSVHVVVENSDNVLIKGIQDGTTTQKDAKTNSNGDLRSALIGNTVKDGTGDNYYVLVDSDGKLQTSGGGGGGSANTNLYPTLASITTATSFAGGMVQSAYVDLTNAKNIVINCIHTGSGTAITNFSSDVALTVEFTDDDTNTVCYSGSSSPVFAFGGIQADGTSTGSAVAVLSLGSNSEASGQFTGKFIRVVAINNDNSLTGTAYGIDFKVVVSGI